MQRLRQLRTSARLAMRMRGERVTVRGNARHDQQPLTVRFVGLPDYFEHVMARVFDDDFEEVERTSAWNGLAFRQFEDGTRAHREGHQNGGSNGHGENDGELEPVDLVIAHLPRPYCQLVGESALEMPCWIIQKARLDRPWEEVVASFRKNTRTTDLRKVRKYGLTPEFTRDPTALKDFYEGMYVPYAKRRFGPFAVVDDFDEVADDVASRGELLQVKHEGEVVGGCELAGDESYMQLLSLGVIDGLERSVEDAALSGIYLFALQRAHGRGCRELGFALTTPNVDDGIYRYKRKWGTVVHDDWQESSILWQPRTFGEPVQTFFAHYPMIYRTPAGLAAKVLLQAPIDGRELRKLAEGYISPGIARLQIYGHHADPLSDADRTALPYVTWYDLSGAERPRELFCQAPQTRAQ